MSDARKRRITITVEGAGATFQASGTTIDFEGFLRAYVEGSDDPEAELANKETLLPSVEQGRRAALRAGRTQGPHDAAAGAVSRKPR